MSKKCICEYDKDNRLLGECLRCFDLENKARERAFDSILTTLVEELEKMRKTEGIVGILGTLHKDGVSNEGYNQAIDDFKSLISKLQAGDHLTEESK